MFSKPTYGNLCTTKFRFRFSDLPIVVYSLLLRKKIDRNLLFKRLFSDMFFTLKLFHAER